MKKQKNQNACSKAFWFSVEKEDKNETNCLLRAL